MIEIIRLNSFDYIYIYSFDIFNAKATAKCWNLATSEMASPSGPSSISNSAQNLKKASAES